ncbi:MAG: 16S rRNA (guanine(966)-N(2))-methyltransferase RsmD [Candidatus Saelkia tenebricola]|nr:16S rRNA (guanine(966)-N(2))-methyltransferase RsmD [Candidatus Saelkia tenebricola]
MQIISGKFKGVRIYTPKNIKITPTSSVVRRAIFDFLSPVIKNKNVIDLYAGTGALGIEALSRGAKKATFVEFDPECVRTIKTNLSKLKNVETQVVPLEVFMAIRLLKGNVFDIFFIDPPYKEKAIKSILLEISVYDIVSENSLFIAEHHKKEIFPDKIGVLALVRQKKYGETVISVFKRQC